MKTSLTLLVGIAVAMAMGAEGGVSEERVVIQDFKLRDFQGDWHELSKLLKHQAVVVAFVGTECPLARLYGRRLGELAERYEPRGVAFLAIDANQQDSLAELAHYARSCSLTIPLVKDPANVVADTFGARRTPEVFVLDGDACVRYRGRIDDQYGVGYARAEAGEHYLADALEALLAGDRISVTATEAVGCHIGRLSRREPVGEITWTKDIAGIFQRRCMECHREGQLAPFSLTSYDDAIGWTDTIREVISQQRMPPWHASPQYGRFVNDSRMSEQEKKLVFEWIDNGAPEGDPRDLPDPIEYVEDWRIGEPELVLSMGKPYQVPAKGVVPYQYFAVDYQVEEDTWIKAAEARPGNRAVVHHLILFYLPPGTDNVAPEAALFHSLAAFAPGMPAWKFPDGYARRIPKGSKLFFQVHYTPNGSDQTDLSSAGLVFAKPESIRKQLTTKAVLNFRFAIPPGAADYRVTASHRFDQDMVLFSLLPHMHLRGKSFRFEAVDPQGKREILLDVPQYDFNWQNAYVLAEPKRMPEGSELHCTAVFDNSPENLVNPDPTATVTWGDQTWEEMMIGSFNAVLEDQDLALGRPSVEPVDALRRQVRFHYRPEEPAQAVYLAGTFNEWKPTAHKMDGPDASGRYSTNLVLTKGSYEYKFVVDGERWKADPGNPDQVGFYHNSLLRLD